MGKSTYINQVVLVTILIINFYPASSLPTNVGFHNILGDSQQRHGHVGHGHRVARQTGQVLSPLSPYYGIGSGNPPNEQNKFDPASNATRIAAKFRADPYELEWERQFRQSKINYGKFHQQLENMEHPLGIVGDLYRMLPPETISQNFLKDGAKGVPGFGLLVNTDASGLSQGLGGKKFGIGMPGYGLFGNFQR